ncbi:aspartate ammonia-lyase [Mesorhizobium sp.]|uniref:aspartate ammonia-lyase n=1 Tax=Mesorhizobium sp. TaxID=1871066 RepID=UPI000FE5DA38|nr:aspartate ammonia-lyase [Mesorhizobium sp.]RWH31309.1 MAG: aspartate ammonia-lyase [Mesorhizobium sp.]RWH38334.1 MAG: aspartate ammonia-lyase [Mesorhizobium sp.]TIM70247.1 MAG: aspartate ammonia-lyase [Mesorhizobium sp.]TIR61590.1 MAG: aspartate ammonia-lyase [Mesorhizobium sp.]TIR72712.1 MAG: aspartate ammonia-lyase [Mesorhizobium sp.]
MTVERTETDMLGERDLPADALFGIHTLRAAENFDVSGIRLRDFPEFVQSLAMVKKAAARTNKELQLLAPDVADAIDRACDRLITCEDLTDHFPIDMMQGGAGTSTNMNVNEVVANLALLEIGKVPGDYAAVHPNDHVNLSQSTNDVYPTAIRVTVMRGCAAVLEAQRRLRDTFGRKGEEFANIAKVGRTQLQDAVPMFLGQEFDAFAETIDEDIIQLRKAMELMREMNLGGTAIGTGLNAPEGFSVSACRHLSEISRLEMVPARNFVEATSDTGAFVSFSGTLKRIAVKLSKICNDLRLLSSGPRAGLGEIRLPPRQAGSSIMPGKVNPVIPEMMNQIGFQIIGNDLTVTLAASAGQLQLNAMEPVIVLNILQSMRLLARGMDILRERCVDGIEADADRCRFLYDQSLILAASLNPVVGYSKAAILAKAALASGTSLRQAAEADGSFSRAQLDQIFGVAQSSSVVLKRI